LRRIPSYSWPCPKMLPASRGFPVQRWPSPMFPSMADKWLKRRCLRRDSRRRPVACLRLPAAYWCLRWACRRRKNRGRDCRHRSRRQEWRPQAESEASVSWISSAARFADYSRNSGVHAPHGWPGVFSRFQPLLPATGSSHRFQPPDPAHRFQPPVPIPGCITIWSVLHLASTGEPVGIG